MAAALFAHSERAHACSCAPPEPLELLERSQAAFVGVALERADDGEEAVWTFEVELSIKGELSERVEVRSALSGVACGYGFGVGTRAGFFLQGTAGAWTGGGCDVVTPEQMAQAGQGLPAPTSRARVRYLVGGAFGAARLIALDRHGHTVGYGFGEGVAAKLSPCPGGRRVVEYVEGRRSRPSSPLIAVRTLRTMEVVREIDLRLAGVEGSVLELECRSPGGDDIVAFVDLWRGAKLLARLGSGDSATLWEGAGHSAGLSRDTAYLCAGSRNPRLVAIDLESAAASELGPLPERTGPLVVSPSGSFLAAVREGRLRGPDAHPTELVLVELGGDAPSVRRVPLTDRRSRGHVRWLSDERLVVMPDTGSRGPARVFDTALRQLGQHAGFPAADLVAGDGRVLALAPRGALRAGTPPRLTSTLATLPTENARAIARIEGPRIDAEIAAALEPPQSIGLTGTGRDARREAADSNQRREERGSARGRAAVVGAAALVLLAIAGALLAARRRTR